MNTKLRITVAVLCGLCAIGIDFTSMLMSVVSDLIFIGGMAYFLAPILKSALEDGE